MMETAEHELLQATVDEALAGAVGDRVDAVLADASAVCLRCDYFEPHRSPDQALRAARHHEQSRGRYRGSMDQRRAQWDRFVAEHRNS